MKTNLNWFFGRPSRSRNSLGKQTARRLRVEQLENRLLLTAELGWAIGMGSTEPRDESYDVATDAAGNSLMAGWFSGTMDFDPTDVHTDNSDILTSVGLHDTFVAKYSAAGKFVWATQMGGPGNDSYDYAYSIAVDGFGDAVVTGAFGHDALFGSIPLVNNGGEDAYVAKLSGGNGNVVWAKGLGGTARDFGRSVAVNMNLLGTGAGDVYISGGFGSSVFFVAKYDTGGNQVWVKQVANPSSDLISAPGIAVNSSTGSVYTTGYFGGYGTPDFDPNLGISTLKGYNFTTFIQKLDTFGNLHWAKQFGNNRGSVAGSDITLDSEGNAYVTGGFSGKVDFDPGIGKLELTSAGGSDVYVTKLDQDGNVGWAMRFGGKGGDDGRCIALDSAKNVFVAGHFSGKVDFNPGTGISYLSSVGSRDIFAVKLDSGANFVWAGSMGGTGDEWLRGMTVDQFSNVLLTGYFSGTMDVDPSSVAYNLTSNGGYDSFLVKWTQPISLLASSSTSVSGNRLAETAARDTQVFPLRKSLEKETANLIDAVHAGQLDLLRRATLPDRDSLDLSVRDSLELIDWKSFDKFDWDSFELLS